MVRSFGVVGIHVCRADEQGDLATRGVEVSGTGDVGDLRTGSDGKVPTNSSSDKPLAVTT